MTSNSANKALHGDAVNYARERRRWQMKMMRTILAIGLLLVTGCACRQPSASMSKDEAIRILENEDPSSRKAIRALRYHAQLEYDAQRKEHLARLQAAEAVEPSPFASGRTGIDQ